MPDEPKEPRPYDRYSVEEQGTAKAAHDKAHDNSPSAEKVQGRGSDQVRNTNMHPEPRPTGEMREGPERESHNAALSKERMAALQSFAATKALKTREQELTRPRPHQLYADQEKGKARDAFTEGRDNPGRADRVQGAGAHIEAAKAKLPQERVAALQSFAAEKARKNNERSLELTNDRKGKDRTD